MTGARPLGYHARVGTSRGLGTYVGMCVLLGTGMARAQPSPDSLQAAARTHFELGREHYDAGRLDEASAEFREAYRLSDRPELLYNIYLAERDAGRTELARDALRAFLASGVAIENRSALEARLAAMDREITATTDVEPAEPRGPPTIGWVLTAGGGALLAGAIVTGVVALSLHSDLEDRCPGGVCSQPGDADDVSRGNTLTVVTDVVGAVGLLALGVGIALLLTGGEDAPEARAEGLRWRF